MARGTVPWPAPVATPGASKITNVPCCALAERPGSRNQRARQSATHPLDRANLKNLVYSDFLAICFSTSSVNWLAHNPTAVKSMFSARAAPTSFLLAANPDPSHAGMGFQALRLLLSFE